MRLIFICQLCINIFVLFQALTKAVAIYINSYDDQARGFADSFIVQELCTKYCN